MTKKESVRHILKQAKEMVETEQNEQYRSLAYPVILRELLKRSLWPNAEGSRSSIDSSAPNAETSDKLQTKENNFDLKPLSPKEFLLSKQIKTDRDKILAIVFYLERHQKMTSINISDLKECLSLAKESSDLNINDKVNVNISKGFLMKVKEKKDNKTAWTLTNKGERFVENDFEEPPLSQ